MGLEELKQITKNDKRIMRVIDAYIEGTIDADQTLWAIRKLVFEEFQEFFERKA